MGVAQDVDSLGRMSLVTAPATGHSRRLTAPRLALFLSVTALLVAASVAERTYRFAMRSEPAPAVRPLDLLQTWSDVRAVAITTTTPAWKKLKEVVTVDRLRTDHTLWQRMHFGDWDVVPRDVREEALRAMIRAYTPLFRDRRAWQRMTPDDWDIVPQPVRAMAFLRMIAFWALVEEVGAEYSLTHDRMSQTIGAIVMAESWFEHRAFNENEWGNRDLGVAQCSDYCRKQIEGMAERGEIGFAAPPEAAYLNPWVGTRVATVWFERELGRAEGDVDLAIRAYHRGIENALDEKGDVYIANVHRLRDRYIRARGPSETWRFLAAEIARL